jgi:hypothetical protein
MRHKVGQLVLNRKLGLGKVLEVSGQTVTVIFKDHPDGPRRINVAAVPMELAKEQTDAHLDDPRLMRRTWGKRTTRRKAAVNAVAARRQAKAKSAE